MGTCVFVSSVHERQWFVMYVCEMNVRICHVVVFMEVEIGTIPGQAGFSGRKLLHARLPDLAAPLNNAATSSSLTLTFR